MDHYDAPDTDSAPEYAPRPAISHPGWHYGNQRYGPTGPQPYPTGMPSRTEATQADRQQPFPQPHGQSTLPSPTFQEPSSLAGGGKKTATGWLVALGVALVISVLANIVLAAVTVKGFQERKRIRNELGTTEARLEEAKLELGQAKADVDKLRQENDNLLKGGAELFRRLDKARDLMKAIDSELESAYSNVYTALDHLVRAFELYGSGYYKAAESEARAAVDALDRFDSNVRRYRQLRDEFRDLVDDLPV
jgi:regulator of replication initiation timing